MSNFFMFIFLLSLFISVILFVWWINNLICKKTKVILGFSLGKLTLIFGCATVIFFFIADVFNVPYTTVADHTVYALKITNITYKKDKWVVSGKTPAPNGYKVLATPISKSNLNYNSQVAESMNSSDYPKVKNGKVKFLISPDDTVDPDNGRSGEKTKIAIFVVNRLSQASDDSVDMPSWSKSLVRKRSNMFFLKLKQKQVNYMNDESDDSISSADKRNHDSKSSIYPDVNKAFPKGVFNYSESDLISKQFHIEGTVTDVAADNMKNYHILITSAHDSEPKYLLVINYKKTGRVDQNDRISFKGVATGFGSINSSQINEGISEKYYEQKIVLLQADKVTIN